MKWCLEGLYEPIKNYPALLEDAQLKKDEESKKIQYNIVSNCEMVIAYAESEDTSVETYLQLHSALNQISTLIKMLNQKALAEEAEEEPPTVTSHFTHSLQTTLETSQRNFLTLQAKLLRMIDFYLVKRIINPCMSQSLGLTYSQLFLNGGQGAKKAGAEQLFFNLVENDYRVYFKEMNNLLVFKKLLEDFDFKTLSFVEEACPPAQIGFEGHTQYLVIPHIAVPKLLALYDPLNEPQTYLTGIYRNAELEPQKCRLADSWGEDVFLSQCQSSFSKNKQKVGKALHATTNSTETLSVFSANAKNQLKFSSDSIEDGVYLSKINAGSTSEESESIQAASNIYLWLITFLIGEIATLQTKYGQEHIKTKQLSYVLSYLKKNNSNPLLLENYAALIHSICARKHHSLVFFKPDSLNRFEQSCIVNYCVLPDAPYFRPEQLNELCGIEDVPGYLDTIKLEKKTEFLFL